jgi:hypothetical protein
MQTESNSGSHSVADMKKGAAGHPLRALFHAGPVVHAGARSPGERALTRPRRGNACTCCPNRTGTGRCG